MRSPPKLLIMLGNHPFPQGTTGPSPLNTQNRALC